MAPRMRAPATQCSAASKRTPKGNKGGGKKSAAAVGAAKGFGAAPPPSPPAKKAPRPSTPPAARSNQLVDVDLGGGKQIKVSLPDKSDEPLDSSAELTMEGLTQRFGHLYGAGDIVWPASKALARMLAHVPSLTAGKRVLELGCGLGASGLAAASAGASSVVLTDRDEALLERASDAAKANDFPDGQVSTALLNWEADAPTVARAIGDQPFDLVIGADLLYDEAMAKQLAKLLSSLLPLPTSDAPPVRVLLADPEQRPNRELFAAACAEAGLSVADDVLPGPEKVRLLGVVRE